MAIMQKQNNFFWLFPDTLEGAYEFIDYDPEFTTRTNKKVPVIILMGKDNKGRVGDFITTIWNIENWNKLISELGEDSDLWKGKILNAESSNDKIKLSVVTNT